MNWLTTIKANIAALFVNNRSPLLRASDQSSIFQDNWDKVYDDIYHLGYIPKGVATSGLNPGSPAENCSYINLVYPINTTFTNFGGITVTAYEFGYFLWNGATWSWTKIGESSIPGTGDVVGTTAARVGEIPLYSNIDGKHIGTSGVYLDIPRKYDQGIGAFTEVFGPNTLIEKIAVLNDDTDPFTLKIGTTLGGEEILPATVMTTAEYAVLSVNIYLPSGGTIYYDVAGSGSVTLRIRFEPKQEFFN